MAKARQLTKDVERNLFGSSLENMADEQYDSIGVTLSLDKRGRFDAKRVFIKGDKIIKSEVLTLGRSAVAATLEAEHSISRVTKEWMRGQIQLAQPEQLKFSFSEDK